MNEESKTHIITFFFTSGLSLDVEYLNDGHVDMIKNLSDNWSDTRLTGIIFGINFSLVTHYVVKVKD